MKEKESSLVNSGRNIRNLTHHAGVNSRKETKLSKESKEKRLTLIEVLETGQQPCRSSRITTDTSATAEMAHII